MSLVDWVRFADGGTAPLTVVLDLLLSYVLGQFVAWLYIWTHRGLSYSRNLTHSIILLTMIVTAVMLVVGDSIARAFGLVGALAIIRFRTVVRDARDTTFIFLALASGIAIGAHHYGVAVFAAVGIGLVSVQLHLTGFGQRHTDTGVLRIRSTAGLESLEEAVKTWCRTHELLSLKETSAGESEYSFEIRLFHPSEREDLRQAVLAVQGTTSATVALEERAEEW
jgi:uncharacterized membrane protein YhiD involved in acid resistance